MNTRPSSKSIMPAALMFFALGINFLGKYIAESLSLPLWLDTIGTMLAGMVGGPIVGALTGLINNLGYGIFVNPVSIVYALSSVALGITVGYMAKFGFTSWLPTILLLGVVTVIISAVVSTPINMFFYDGYTFNAWGDAIYERALAATGYRWLSAFINELSVDIPDKFLSALIAQQIFSCLPRDLVKRFSSVRGDIDVTKM
ncbi:MAG: ECF transporter S component [Clostridiales bacterium]|nr:ECF transporter S component [Clostridiales bacterium]